MRALIVGADGQLGRELRTTTPPGWTVAALGRGDLDVTDRAAVDRAVEAHTPSTIFNAAAYNAVDAAESAPDAAFAGNAVGPEHLARSAAVAGARVVHVSTDYVFDGATGHPYTPDSTPNPLSVYGASKLEGERRVLRAAGTRAVVVRTAWVHSIHRQNFVKVMLKLLAERDEVSVVADQVSAPTAARSLARLLWSLASRPELSGVFHWTDAGVASRYDEAVAVAEEAAAVGLLPRPARIRPIRSDAYPTPARRPFYSVLDSSTTADVLGEQRVHWRTGVRQVIGELAEAARG